MANFKTETWHYFPEKITVGYAKRKKSVNFCTPETDVGNFAFVTCKYKNAAWVSATQFKSICGYSPANMKDSAKQFEKMVTAAVSEFDNAPTEGFRLISYDDSEKICNVETRGVIISDPRGFTIFMKYVDFFEILKNNGIAPNGVISGKYAYGWDCDMRMKLICAESDKYKVGFEKSKLFYGKNNSGFIVKKDLVKGKTYVHVGNGGHMSYMMYLGEFQTYGIEYHLEFLETGKYRDIADFKNDLKEHHAESRMTTDKAMVFYNFGSNEPYVMKNSVSKFFEREANTSEYESFVMYNDPTLPADFETIMTDMQTHPLFNRLRAKFGDLEPVSADTLLNIFARQCLEIKVKKRLSYFYFNYIYGNITLIDRKQNKLFTKFENVIIYSNRHYDNYDSHNKFIVTLTKAENIKTNNYWSGSSINSRAEYNYDGDSVNDIMSKYEFYVPELSYENGMHVPQEYAIAFYSTVNR